MLAFKNELLVNKLKIYKDEFRLSLLNYYLNQNEITLNNEDYDKYIVRVNICNCLANSAKIQYEHDNNMKYWSNSGYLGNLYHKCKYNPIYENLYHIENIRIINITGNYEIKEIYNGIEYVSDDLYLNNIPIKKLQKYKKNRRDLIHWKFSFNLEKYSQMVDYVLASYYRRFKYILFRYLPLELIKYILYLTSIN
jgi:hypothetical protein